ncbi:hypothetical protein ACOME3_003412 [Neoechinorhynchus agilis]
MAFRSSFSKAQNAVETTEESVKELYIPRDLFVPSILNPMRETPRGLKEGRVQNGFQWKNATCSGCGAKFQPISRHDPGFIDADKLNMTSKINLNGLMLCRRCFLLSSPQVSHVINEDYHLRNYEDDDKDVVEKLVTSSKTD